MIKKGDIVTCIRRRKLTGDISNFAKSDLVVGKEYVVIEVNNEYGEKHQTALTLAGEYFEHLLSNFELKE